MGARRADGTPASAGFTDSVTGVEADPAGRNVCVDTVDPQTPRFYRVRLQ